MNLKRNLKELKRGGTVKEKKPLFILVGPTAIGKTDLSVELAKKLNGEIISADSMQIYKGMDIGTAKIREDEKKGIKHYLIDEVSPHVEFSVSDFQEKANGYIDEILKKDKLPMVVGGTGLYINSLIYDLNFSVSVSNWELRDKYTELAKIHGNQYVHDELRLVDPVSADRIHVNDIKRVTRALEVYHETGKPMAEYYKDFRKPNNEFDIVMIGLTMDREKLYDRINKRVNIMLEEGLIEEVKDLLDKGYDENLTSMQAIGYKEVMDYLKGGYSLEETIGIIKQGSRRYAKRQITWFKKEERIHWIDLDEIQDKDYLVKYIINYTKDKFS